MEELDIPKIGNKLISIQNVVKNWRRIYDALELPEAEADNLAQRKITNLITNYELITEILRLWKSAKGNLATIQKLEIVLRDLELNSAADMVAPLNFPLQHNYQGIVAKYIPRPELEQEIISSLTTNVNNGCEIDFSVVVLQGIGGVGKSTLAKKMCQLAKDGEFNKNFIWIDAETEEQIIKGFAQLLGKEERTSKASIQPIMKKYYETQLKDKESVVSPVIGKTFADWWK